MGLEFLTSQPNVTLELQFIPKVHQKVTKAQYSLDQIRLKGVTAKGIRLASKPVKKLLSVKTEEKK